MMHTGALQPLPPRPSALSTSHQTAINTGQVTFTPPNGPSISFTLDEADLRSLTNEAAALDLSNLMRNLGTLENTTSTTTFKDAASLLPQSCRLQAATGGQAAASSTDDLVALTSFT